MRLKWVFFGLVRVFEKCLEVLGFLKGNCDEFRDDSYFLKENFYFLK